MWQENTILTQDMELICSGNDEIWKELDGKSILVTGVTGLIGQTLVKALLYRGFKSNDPPKVIAFARDRKKTDRLFGTAAEAFPDNLVVYYGNIEEKIEIEENVDYIIHAAAQTSSRAFINSPVETIETAYDGTKNMLELAVEKRAKGFVFLSTVEVYGYPEKGTKVKEEDIGKIRPLVVRNSYPLGKQMCENLCKAYSVEHCVPAKILRLTQTFGPGIDAADFRVFAEFARCITEKKNIVLRTLGETERAYLYTADAATAILTVMIKGEEGCAYNAANEDTYCSIKEMAQELAQANGIEVEYHISRAQDYGYADTLYMDLDTTKLRKLGWKAQVNLPDMFARMIESMNS